MPRSQFFTDENKRNQEKGHTKIQDQVKKYATETIKGRQTSQNRLQGQKHKSRKIKLNQAKIEKYA